MTGPRKTKPGAGGRRVSDAIAGYRALYGKTNPSGSSARMLRAPANWRDRLPDPATYYADKVKLGKRSGEYTMALCPFHDDHNPSLGVKLGSERGHFRCFACGEHGDMVTFHMKRTGMKFAEAVRDLLGVHP